MREYNVLTQGQKIKYIREKYGFKQEDLVCGEATRNLISLLENDRANLTPNIAKIIEHNINAKFIDRKIDFRVTKEYFLEDVTSQAKKIAKEYIEYIKVLEANEINEIDETLLEIDLFLKTYDVEEMKSRLYLEIGMKFRESNIYLTAISYFLRAYESSCDAKITNLALVRLGSCYIYLSRYSEALNYYHILLSVSNDREQQYIARFNIALCYKKLKEYEKSIANLDSIIKEYKDLISQSVERNFNVKLLKGSCLNELNLFNNAIETYTKLLNSLKDTYVKERLIVMSNLADVYRITNDFSKLNKICCSILEQINNNPTMLNEYDTEIRLTLARNIKSSSNDKDVVIKLLMDSLESFKSGKSLVCLDDVEEMISNILDILIFNGDSLKIDSLKNDVFQLIKNNKFPKCSTTLLKFINYYNCADRKEDISNIIKYVCAC